MLFFRRCGKHGSAKCSDVALAWRCQGRYPECMLEIDGSLGEGGGQILRSSLTLSMLTGQGFSIHSVRAHRPRPGLQAQHLAAVRAAAHICGAEVRGAERGSGELSFSPRKVRGGSYHFSIGTAGSTTLLLQTVIPSLLFCGQASRVRVEGGTHNPQAPPADFLEHAWLPVLRSMGATLELKVIRCGFYPTGGGCLELALQPVSALAPFLVPVLKTAPAIRAWAYCSRLAPAIARDELKIVRHALALENTDCRVRDCTSPGAGNTLHVHVAGQGLDQLFSGFGRKGKPREQVATDAIRQAKDFLNSGADTGPLLADQLLLPMALAGTGGFTTTHITNHAQTNIQIIERFLDCRFHCTEQTTGIVHISVG